MARTRRRNLHAGHDAHWRIVPTEHGAGIEFLCRPDQDHQAAQQDAECNGNQYGREHRFAGHPAHQHVIDNNTHDQTGDRGQHKCEQRIAAERPRGCDQQIGARHHQLAMRKVQYAADAIDENVTRTHQRIDRGKHKDVGDELQRHAGSR